MAIDGAAHMLQLFVPKHDKHEERVHNYGTKQQQQ
jgi:hypothetical protein